MTGYHDEFSPAELGPYGAAEEAWAGEDARRGGLEQPGYGQEPATGAVGEQPDWAAGGHRQSSGEGEALEHEGLEGEYWEPAGENEGQGAEYWEAAGEHEGLMYEEPELEDLDDGGVEYEDLEYEDPDSGGQAGEHRGSVGEHEEPGEHRGGAEPGRAPGGAHRRRGSSGPSHQRASRRQRKLHRRGRHRRWIFASLAVVVVVVVLAGLVAVVYGRRQIDPPGPLGPKVAVKIPAGSSTSEIGRILAAAGVIHDGRLFPFYVKVNGASDLLPGHYELAKNESYGKVVSALQQGPPLIVDKLTIPEGFTLDQIAARVAALPGLHLSAAKFLAAGTSGQVRSEFEPKGSDNLEGLVFPATYEVRQGQEEADVLQEMVDTFDLRATALGLAAAAAKLHLTPYQVVTVASIVEREAKLESDRGDVASTLYNRLAKGMPLGADSTQTYYLRLTDPDLMPTVTQLNTPSPYNTRTQVGLPPTPISNPGIPSLQAAMDPPATTYLYFVEVNPDGKLGFASDSAGFAQLQTECQQAHLC